MKRTIYTALVLLITAGTFAQSAGKLNNNFGTNGYQWLDLQNKDQYGSGIAVQPDGKIVVAAIHEHTTNKYDWLIYRLKKDGTLDNSFSSDGRVTDSFSDKDRLEAVAVGSNGQIVLVGYVESNSNGKNMLVMQLEPDGSVDNSFGTNGVVELDPSIGGDDYAMDVDIAPNGKIYVAGMMVLSGDAYFTAYRLNTDGSPDNSFSLNGYNFEDMDAPGAIYDGDLASDGSYFLAGAVVENNITKMAVLKFTSTGKLDDNFAGDGVKVYTPALNQEAYLNGIAALPNGGVIGVGIAASGQGTNSVVTQLNASGLLDPTFNGNGVISHDLAQEDGFRRIKRLANGKYLVIGYKKVGGDEKGMLVQLNSDGSIDYNGYANGSGKVNITISSGEEQVMNLAVTNNYAYTIGNYENGSHDDIFISSTTLVNPIAVQEFTLNPGAMKLFPNPVQASQPFNVLLNQEVQGNVEVTVTSITGVQMYADHFYKASSEYNHNIELNDLSPGVYLVRIVNNDKVGTQKLIVQ